VGIKSPAEAGLRTGMQRITPAAVATFNAMLATNDATLYDELLSQLHDQLDLLPWQGPAVVDPGEECPYPKDTAAYEWWPTAQALYRLLSQAAAAPPRSVMKSRRFI
jgi:hypothetical protein